MTENGRRFLAFPDAEALGAWLAEHHTAATEVWVRTYKADFRRPSVTWTDCVTEAIRFGWIDGQKLPLDEASYLQRLTPRRPRSHCRQRTASTPSALSPKGG